MIVVSDTTPLIPLLKIDRIDLLEKLFGQVLIPQSVFDELTTDERFTFEADQIRRKQFIKVKAVRNPEAASILKRATGLDQGERHDPFESPGGEAFIRCLCSTLTKTDISSYTCILRKYHLNKKPIHKSDRANAGNM